MFQSRFQYGLLCITLFGFLTWTESVSAARKLYVLTAADTQDEKIGSHAKSDVVGVRTMLSANVAGDDLVLLEQLTDAKVTRNGILESIGQLSPTSEDAVLMYYSGHAAYFADQQHYLVTQGGKESTPRTAILDALKEKGFGLVILMTDSCFNFAEGVAPRRGYSSERAPQQTAPLFRKLFFEVDGVIDVNSAKKGQVAGTYPTKGQGSIYTKALCSILGENKASNSLTWDAILTKIETKTRADFRQFYPDGYQVDTPTGVVNQRDQQLARLTVDLRPLGAPGTGGDGNPNDGGNNGTNNGGNNNNGNGSGNGGVVPPLRATSIRLGVTVQNHQGRGVLIIGVSKGGPATKCVDSRGQTFILERGDKIIALNRTAISDVGRFTTHIRNSPADARIQVEGKDGDVHEFSTRLVSGTNVPAENNGNGGNNAGNKGTRFGAYVATNGNRAQVTGLVPDSPAERCRDRNGENWHLERGDIILRINGQAVASEQEFRQAIINSKREMTLDVLGSDRKVYHFTSTLNY